MYRAQTSAKRCIVDDDELKVRTGCGARRYEAVSLVDKGAPPFALVQALAIIADRTEVEIRAPVLDGVADVLPMQQIVRARLPVCGVGNRIDYRRPRSGNLNQAGPQCVSNL